jgi:hypothetical protein
MGSELTGSVSRVLLGQAAAKNRQTALWHRAHGRCLSFLITLGWEMAHPRVEATESLEEPEALLSVRQHPLNLRSLRDFVEAV